MIYQVFHRFRVLFYKQNTLKMKQKFKIYLFYLIYKSQYTFLLKKVKKKEIRVIRILKY